MTDRDMSPKFVNQFIFIPSRMQRQLTTRSIHEILLLVFQNLDSKITFSERGLIFYIISFLYLSCLVLLQSISMCRLSFLSYFEF